MTRSVSITRRLIVTVLVLELLSAIALIGAITVHERHMQLQAFDASLVATGESLMGAVQDAEDEDDTVMLDMRAVQVAKDAIYRVKDEKGRLLGSIGDAPNFDRPLSEAPVFRNADVQNRGYRFLVMSGLRMVDPGKASGGVGHSITIIYGTPVKHVWHEVLEATRFFAIATVVLLGITALVMALLVRKGLSPIHDLAREAERISSSDWHFDTPINSKETLELRPLANALEGALARLQRSFEQQRRFTSDAAHELKTDVAVVKSSLQLLSMRKRTVEDYSQGVAISLNDIMRLETAVQKMLDLARLETPIRRDSLGVTTRCSLLDVVGDAVNQTRPLAELKTVNVSVECATDAKVRIDSRDALLLCSNILQNALQYSPVRGTVRIALTVDRYSARLTVQDQGMGISEEDRAHAFEPFYRGDPSRSRKSGSTGLGLSICKAICERAGGVIEIANNATGGALVTVNLPGEIVAFDSAVSAPFKEH
jgi:two-component system OmpR family sensor kinase